MTGWKIFLVVTSVGLLAMLCWPLALFLVGCYVIVRAGVTTLNYLYIYSQLRGQASFSLIGRMMKEVKAEMAEKERLRRLAVRGR